MKNAVILDEVISVPLDDAMDVAVKNVPLDEAVDVVVKNVPLDEAVVVVVKNVPLDEAVDVVVKNVPLDEAMDIVVGDSVGTENTASGSIQSEPVVAVKHDFLGGIKKGLSSWSSGLSRKLNLKSDL